MLSNLFTNLTATIYRRTTNAKQVKSWTSQGTCTGKIGGYSNGTTMDGQSGMNGYRFYTESSIILVGDKLVIDSKSYIVGYVTKYKSAIEEYSLCIINASDGN